MSTAWLTSRARRLLPQALPRTEFGRWPLACGAAGALLLVATTGFAIAAAIPAALLLLASSLAGRTLEQRHAQALVRLQRDARAEIDHATRLCSQAAPVWVRQIETVRGEGNHEVAELAQVFGELCGKLDRVLGPAGPGAGSPEEILAGLERNGGRLEGLVAALRRLQESKDRIVRAIDVQAAQLKENASDIRQIALNIRMVSLNATIEAARAGAAGKPFGVIVADMRALAARTAEASDDFSQHTDRLQRTLAEVFAEQQAEGSGETVSIAAAENLVQHVVASSAAMMRQLTQAIAAMEDERRDIRSDVSRALVALQFQDRVSQILSHVAHNLEEMRSRIEAGHWQALDGHQWLERIASNYSTHEEFTNHATSPLPATQTGSAITFF